MNIKLTFIFVAILSLLSVSSAFGKNKKQEDFEVLQKKVEKNLAKFDKLDFTDFSGQRWENFKETHSQNVRVHWPDGHVTEGLYKPGLIMIQKRPFPVLA
jgi:biotin-(acetyl-CoA carboxylase) ligase